MTERLDYDALAQDINLEDITSCERNANILRKIRDGDTNWSQQLFIMNEDDEDEILDGDFVFAEGDDLGWLGYFVGKSEVIKYLHINYIGGDNYFFDGMSQNRSIEELEISYSDIGDDSWITLCRSFLGNNHNLSRLEFQGIVIGHEGAQNLASALGRMNNHSLKHLSMEGNEIGDEGLAEIATALQSEAHSLETLSLYGINFGDDGAMALAEGLRGNRCLKELSFDVETAGITTIGWSAFSGLLCDTSTIKSTYLSNHTLTRLGNYQNKGTPQRIRTHLSINKYRDRDAAICKILRSHPDLDMEPFFKLNMKFLPAVMCWVDRVERKGMESTRSSQSRKLSALYKFVRGMPDLTTIGYWEGRVIDIEAKKRMLDDEEAVAWERLGGRPIDDASKRKRMRHE
ncbi:hypothetical protein ACHAWC_006127 [Mediolabrus comicus]